MSDITSLKEARDILGDDFIDPEEIGAARDLTYNSDRIKRMIG